MTAFKPELPVPPADLSLPTMYDLPSENSEDAGLPDEFHRLQADLLIRTFQPATYPADRVFAASDLNLYYDVQNRSYYKRPDWFGVVDVPSFVDAGRLSYARWQEGRSPIIVVELLSPNTMEEDQGLTERGKQPPSKWEVYEQVLQVPYYVLFNRVGDSLQPFQLENGFYKEQAERRLWIPELQIGLGLWQGAFTHWERLWLRWYDADGHWIVLAEEQLEIVEEQLAQEQQARVRAERQAQQEQQAREQAERRAQALTERLRAMGIDPDML